MNQRKCPTCHAESKQQAGPYRGRQEHQSQAASQVVLKIEQHVSGIAIDRCPACSGAFLDAGELDKVKTHIRRQTPSRDAAWDLFRRSGARALRPDQPIQEDKPPRKCPQCEEDMVEREWDSSMVMVDVCLDCRGVWLDSEELETLETYFGA